MTRKEAEDESEAGSFGSRRESVRIETVTVATE